MITLQITYDMPESFGFPDDARIEQALKPHCTNLELQGSGAGFGRRDLEYWADDVDPDIDFEYILEPLFLNGLEVNVYEEEHDDD